MSARRRFPVAITGVVLAGVYLTVAYASFSRGLFPVRPLYEGAGPPPAYRWVVPPPDLTKNNQQPAAASKVIALGPKGSERDSLNTPDVQATMILPPGAFRPQAGETGVKISITPLDPASIGAPPTGSYDGNAYTFSAAYVPSGTPAPLQTDPSRTCPPAASAKDTTCLTIVLRYAFNADKLWHRGDKTWAAVANPSTTSAALQIYADTPQLGTYVATQALAFDGSPAPKSGKSGMLGFIAGFAALLLGTLAARARASKRNASGKNKKKSPAKGKKQPGSKAQKRIDASKRRMR